MEDPPSKTAVFWDYENVPFTSGALTNFLNDIEEIKKNLGVGSLFRCFGVWSNVPEPIQTEINEAGFELIQVPQTRKNAVDHQIEISAIDFFHQIHYTEFYLISADGDFAALLSDLRKKGVKNSIIARQKSISEDLKPYCSELFYVTSKGNLFQNINKTREEIIEDIGKSMIDAQKAYDNLIQRQVDKDIQIFHVTKWREAYLSLEEYEVSPLIIGQLVSFEEMFQTFIKVFGYGHTKSFNYFCIHPSTEKQDLNEVIQHDQIPNVMRIRAPVRKITITNIKELLGEFSSEELTKEAEPKPIKTSEISVEDTTKSIDTEMYVNQIAKSFREMVQDKKNGEIKLTNLNSNVCEAIGVPTSRKLYKIAGFKTFTKAVEAARKHFARKTSIKKDSIFF